MCAQWWRRSTGTWSAWSATSPLTPSSSPTPARYRGHLAHSHQSYSHQGICHISWCHDYQIKVSVNTVQMIMSSVKQSIFTRFVILFKTFFLEIFPNKIQRYLSIFLFLLANFYKILLPSNMYLPKYLRIRNYFHFFKIRSTLEMKRFSCVQLFFNFVAWLIKQHKVN